MAQAFARLGTQVTVLEAGQLLGRDDPELVVHVKSNCWKMALPCMRVPASMRWPAAKSGAQKDHYHCKMALK